MRPERTEVAPSAAARTVRMGTATARWVIAASVLGSGIAFLDGTVVNVALPAIARNLNAGVAGLQWTVDAYLITLTALMLLGGSLGGWLVDTGSWRLVFLINVPLAAAAIAIALRHVPETREETMERHVDTPG